MSAPFTAIMIVILVATSQTPREIQDDTHVIAMPFTTLSECIRELRGTSLSDEEAIIPLAEQAQHVVSASGTCGLSSHDMW
jgi:hypothetical protein